VGVKTENTHVKEDELEKCSKTGSAESVSSDDQKPITKGEEDEAENQDIEGNHIKEGNKLDKNIKETSSEKPVHSFFGNCNNYYYSKPLHVLVLYSRVPNSNILRAVLWFFLVSSDKHSDIYCHVELINHN
jgi:hypothetical protein